MFPFHKPLAVSVTDRKLKCTFLVSLYISDSDDEGIVKLKPTQKLERKKKGPVYVCASGEDDDTSGATTHPSASRVRVELSGVVLWVTARTILCRSTSSHLT